MSSINTNIGAYSAQQNLRSANAATTSSIGKLSSGNRIQRAADDVAGLSVGTILQTNVSTLRKGLENAGQANSLLQVADGGLKNITNILQRQKALSVAATSGILSAAERGYLNQEFQNLTSEIDRLVDNTKFNSVKLLDGTLSSQATATTSTKDNGAGTAVTVANVLTATGTVAEGDTVTVNGVTLTFIAATATPTGPNQVVIGAAAAQTAANVARALNSSGDARLQNYYFTNGGTANIDAEWGGGKIDLAATGGVALISSASNTTNVTNTGTKQIAASAANALDGNGRARTFIVGQVGNAGGILASGGTAATCSD